MIPKNRRGDGKPPASWLAVFVVLAAAGLLAGARPAAAAPASLRRARLETGPDRIRGLPFFGTNAILGLSGSYSLGGRRAAVYFSRSPLYYDESWAALGAGKISAGAAQGTKASSWKALAGAQMRELGAAEGGGSVIALRKSRYTLFIWLPRIEAGDLDFAAAFAERFEFFSAAATDDSGISFPAFVDY